MEIWSVPAFHHHFRQTCWELRAACPKWMAPLSWAPHKKRLADHQSCYCNFRALKFTKVCSCAIPTAMVAAIHFCLGSDLPKVRGQSSNNPQNRSVGNYVCHNLWWSYYFDFDYHIHGRSPFDVMPTRTKSHNISRHHNTIPPSLFLSISTIQHPPSFVGSLARPCSQVSLACLSCRLACRGSAHWR